MESSSGSLVMMGLAGWIIALVGVWAVVGNNGRERFSGGASWMAPAMRRFWAIVLVLFGATLIVGSFVL